MINNDEPPASTVENLIESDAGLHSVSETNDTDIYSSIIDNDVTKEPANGESEKQPSFILNENHVKLKRPLSNPALRIDCKKITRPSSAIGIVQATDYPDFNHTEFKPIEEENESPNSKENYVEINPKSPPKTVDPLKPQKSNYLGQIINSLLSQEEHLIRLKGSNYLENVQRYAANLKPMDCCFIVEKCRPFNCDTVFMSYFREQYLTPILIHLNGGPPLNADFGRDAYTSIYSMLNFSAANCKDGCKTMVSDTPSIYRLLKESTQMHFIERHFQPPPDHHQKASVTKTSPMKKATKGGDINNKVAIQPILESIEEEFLRLNGLREGLTNSVVRHCFLLMCSPISFDGIEKTRKPGDIIDRLIKLDIKLTIFSPIRENSFSVLYEMINRTCIDPIFDKTWQTIFLSVPLMKNINGASSTIIGPVASAHHAEEQAKIAMRSTFGIQQQHQQQTQHQQQFMMNMNNNSPRFTGNGPNSTGPDLASIPNNNVNTNSPVFIHSQQQQQHQSHPTNPHAQMSPNMMMSKNPGNGGPGPGYNYNSGPQSAPNHQSPTVQSPYPSQQQQQSLNGNQIHNSPYGIAQNGPQYPQNPVTNQQQQQQQQHASLPRHQGYPPSSQGPGQMPSSAGAANTSIGSGPPSVGTPNTNGRKSIQDPGSVHSNSGNENPQSWGHPCTPNQSHVNNNTNNSTTTNRSHTPIQTMNMSGMSNSEPSPMQVSVPSPTFAFANNTSNNQNQPQQHHQNPAFVANSPSGVAIQQQQQFNSHPFGHPRNHGSTAVTMGGQVMPTGLQPQQAQHHPPVIMDNSQKLHRTSNPNIPGHLNMPRMQQSQPTDSLGMLISSGTINNNSMPQQQQHQQQPPPPSMHPSSMYSPQVTTPTTRTSDGNLANNTMINSNNNGQLQHQQRQQQLAQFNGGGQAPPPPGSMQYNFPITSTQSSSSVQPSGFHPQQQSSQMVVTKQQSFGGHISTPNSMDEMSRYQNQMNYNPQMGGPPTTQNPQQYQQRQHMNNKQGDMGPSRINQKMTQKQFFQQQQQQQQLLMSQANNVMNPNINDAPGNIMQMPKSQSSLQMKGQQQSRAPNMGAIPGQLQQQQQHQMMMPNQVMRNPRIMNPNMNIVPGGPGKPMDSFDLNAMGQQNNSGGVPPQVMQNFASNNNPQLQFNPMMSNQPKYQLQNVINNSGVGGPNQPGGLVNPMDNTNVHFSDDRQKFINSQQQQHQQNSNMIRQMTTQRLPVKMPNYPMQNNQAFMMNPNQQQQHQQAPQLLQNFHPSQHQQRPRFL